MNITYIFQYPTPPIERATGGVAQWLECCAHSPKIRGSKRLHVTVLHVLFFIQLHVFCKLVYTYGHLNVTVKTV